MTTSRRHAATEARLRGELNTALRERDTARSERDAARLVIGAQADEITDRDLRIADLAEQLDQADQAHRAALADLAEAHRDEPDMDRCG